MKLRLLQTALALCALVASFPISAAQRTFVSNSGVDNLACSIATPCRQFAAAIAATSAGGEVVVLDSAGYGPVAITQAVSIIAPPGVYAGISAFFGPGIVVNPGSGAVVLSGLTINGLGGTTGIDFQSGDSLRVERTTVSGFSGIGLKAAHGAAATLIIRDSAFVANGGGLFVTTSTGSLTVEIGGSRFDQNTGIGAIFDDNVSGVVSESSFSKNSSGAVLQPITIGGTNKMTFRNCIFSANSNEGLLGGGMAGITTTQIADSEISDNGSAGVTAQTDWTVTLSNTTVTRNSWGVHPVGGIIRSFQDNRLYGNSNNGGFTSTIAKQ